MKDKFENAKLIGQKQINELVAKLVEKDAKLVEREAKPLPFKQQ